MNGTPTNDEEFRPTTHGELARFVEENARGERRALSVVGGRTALNYGYTAPAPAITVATSELRDVVDYPARDMTITVDAGIRVEELQKTLAQEHQRLPVDVPQAHRASLGGAIATNTSGPGRLGYGTFRDYVIGISAIDGTGRQFSAGGRVVKNVAGYDLCKLLIGSLGTLAAITQVTLKLVPVPATRRCLWASCPSGNTIEQALTQLNGSPTRPTAIEILNSKAAWQIRNDTSSDLPGEHPVLCIFFEGGDAETDWQVNQCRTDFSRWGMQDIIATDQELTDKMYSALVEYQAASDDPLTFQGTMLPSSTMEFFSLADERGIALQAHAGSGLVIGHLPDSCTTAQEAGKLLEPLRRFAEQKHGALVVLNCDNSWKSAISLFGDQNANQLLNQRVKRALDPHGLLNPERMWRTEGESFE